MAKKETVQDSALQELKKDIRDKNLGNCYIFYGEETFLKNHYLEQIYRQRIDELTESFNYRKLTAENFTLQELIDGVEAVPMMAEYTLTVVDDVDIWKFNEDDRTRLSELLLDLPEYCTLIFTYETVEWKLDGRYKKLCDAVKKSASIVEFPKQEARDLLPWIARHFAAEKKRIAPNLCSYLLEITDGTMTTLAGEISKVCAFSGTEEITKSDIDAVVEPALDAIIYEISEQLTAGETGKALVKLTQVLKMQEEPISVLGSIGAHFRKLSTARVLQDSGSSYLELMSLYRMSDWAARKTMQSASKFSHRFLQKTAELIVETDRKMKTSTDDAKRLLEVLLLEISQEARNG